MNTSPVSLIDTFDLCTEAVIEESSFFLCPTFDDSHCQNDSRDAEFDKTESRLAYLNKFGFFNIKFSEKCISMFLNEYNDLENAFPLANLKVCSLSNGPGLDLVGLFCALSNCNKVLSCPPEVQAVSLYDSWLRIYISILGKTYKAACQKLFSVNTPIIYENIKFTQSDIFADISPEAEDSISNSNVLLMFKVFYSTKAKADVQNKTLKKIFSLLKPGTLIFFTGSKNNFKNFSKCSLFNDSVKCIFGPQKVKLENLSYPEYLIGANSIKPQDSGHSEFVVWQKKENDISNGQKASKRRSRRKKTKISEAAANLCSENITQNLDDTDLESVMSYSSCSKQSESSEEVKNKSETCVLNSSENNNIDETLKKLQKIECGISSATAFVLDLNPIVLDYPIIDIDAIKEIEEELLRIEYEIFLIKTDFSIFDKTGLDIPAIDNNDTDETLDKLQSVEWEISSTKATVSVLDANVLDIPAIDNDTDETLDKLQSVEWEISSTKATVSDLDANVLDIPAINNSDAEETQNDLQRVECGISSEKGSVSDSEKSSNNLENTDKELPRNHLLDVEKMNDGVMSTPQVTKVKVTENKILSNVDSLLEHIINSNSELEFNDISLKNPNTVTDEKLKFEATSLSNSNAIVDGKLDFQERSLKNGNTISGVKLDSEDKDESWKNSCSEKESLIKVLEKKAKACRKTVEKLSLINASIINQINTQNKTTQNEKKPALQNQVPKLKNGSVNSNTSFERIKCSEKMPSPLKQKKISEKAAENVLLKSSSKINKIQSLDGSLKVNLRAANKDIPQAAAQNDISAAHEKNKNVLHDFASNVATNNTCSKQNLNNRNNDGVKSLIERCEELVTVLEKVTVAIKREMNSKCVNEYVEKSCYKTEPHTKFCAPCCSVNIRNSCCCSKNLNCCCMKNTCFTPCLNSLPCGSRVREQYSCASSANIRNSCCCNKTFNCCCMKSIRSTHCPNSLPCRSSIREQRGFERERCDTSKTFITLPLQNGARKK